MKKTSSKPTNTPMKPGKHTGSVMNWIMSGSNKAPEVGKGATELMWSDRHAYQVLKVSKDYKDVIIRRCKSKRIDSRGMSECQEYDYSELTGPEITLRWAYGAYRQKVWDDAWNREKNDWEDFVYASFEHHHAKNPDLTFKEWSKHLKKFRWEKMNIIFGIQEEYYDFSF